MLVISWPVPSKSVAARAEKRETDTCAAWFLPIHMKHFFNHLMIYIFMVSTWSFFGFGIRIYPYHITRLDPYFLHLAGAHFVPLACAHCYCPGGRSKIYVIYILSLALLFLLETKTSPKETKGLQFQITYSFAFTKKMLVPISMQIQSLVQLRTTYFPSSSRCPLCTVGLWDFGNSRAMCPSSIIRPDPVSYRI